MSIMAKTPSGYKKIGSAYLGERPVDKVFNANGDVVYALQRELTGVPPLLFKGKEQSDLLNYRIYGDTVDGNSVGDLVESGEHAGEYKVPVTVEGKNLLQNTATSRTINGVTFTVNEDGSVTCNGTASATTFFTCSSDIIISKKAFLTGCPNDGGAFNYLMKIQKHSNSDTINNDIGVGAEFYYADPIDVVIRIASGYTCDNLTFYPMIRKADIEDNTYEPYQPPVTTPIYLPEPIKMVGDEAEYIDYAEQKFVKKFYELTLNFDDMNNSETYPGWSGGTALKEYCNKIRSLATDNPNSYIPIQCSSISNFTATFNVNGNNSILYLGNSNIIGHTQSELKEIYAGQSITFILKISDTDLDVTLPALPTIKGTNTMSVDTEVQPSRMDIKGRIKSLT